MDTTHRDRAPEAWRHLTSQLESGERPLVWFEADLSAELRFDRQLIVVTDRSVVLARLEAKRPGAPEIVAAAIVGKWPRSEIESIRQKDQSGTSSLEVRGRDRLATTVRCTKSKGTEAARFAQRATSILANDDAAISELATTVCPECGAVLGPDDVSCPACHGKQEAANPKSLLRLWRFAGPRRWHLLSAIGLTLASSFVDICWIYFTIPLARELGDRRPANEPVDMTYVGWLLAGLCGMSVVGWALNWARTYVMAMLSENVSADLRNATFEHLQKLSLDYFGNKRSGDLISRINNDTDRINYFLSVNVAEFSRAIVFMVQAATVMLYLNPWLALATLIPFPLIAWIIQIARERLRHGFALSAKAWSEMLSVLADNIPGIRVVKAFAQENREIERFAEANQHIVSAGDRVNRVWSLFSPVITLLTQLGLLIVWAYGAWQISLGLLPFSMLQAFLQWIGRFYGELDSMSRLLAMVQRSAASTQRLFEILDKQPSVPEPKIPVRPGRLDGKVELCGVRFSYGTREVIKGVSLAIEPGEMIGLVGPSGAGKSTLVNLVCRFYDVSTGAILVDGTDIRSYPTIDYRSNIGIVLQEPYLFYGTIAENIAYGRPKATRREIIDAARASKAHDFIVKLPDGYDSIVGERGQSLSGGERQRVSIARALLTDPRILILDEATSAVDTETERDIQEALDNLTRGRTTIAIAHRLSTLRLANRIVVMENGQIVEAGPPQELLARGGAYARLHQAQIDLSTGASR